MTGIGVLIREFFGDCFYRLPPTFQALGLRAKNHMVVRITGLQEFLTVYSLRQGSPSAEGENTKFLDLGGIDK